MMVKRIVEKTGYKILIEDVHGFNDARRWIYRCINAGIVQCGQCDKPATNVFWQDQAEWYCRCEEHREYGQQWTGSTHWNPYALTLFALKEKAETFIAELPEDERVNLKVYAYDATDYWSMMGERAWPPDRVLLSGREDFGKRVVIRPLTNGRFAYEIEDVAPNYCYTHSTIGQFLSREDAIEHATKSVNR